MLVPPDSIRLPWKGSGLAEQQYDAPLKHGRANGGDPGKIPAHDPTQEGYLGRGDRSCIESIFSRWDAGRETPRLMARSKDAKLRRLYLRCIGDNIATRERTRQKQQAAQDPPQAA